MANKLNIPMCLACVLLCLTLITSHFFSGLYARYIAKGSDFDGAVVATFDLTEDKCVLSEELVLTVTPGVTEAKIQVLNKSEVAVEYSITVLNVTQNLPLEFQVESSTATKNEHTATYGIPPNTNEVYTIKVIWNQEDALEYMGMVDLVKITVNANQMD